MSLGSSDVLFVGLSNDVVAWYRCGMPSFYLGCDYVALGGQPPNLKVRTSLSRFPDQVPDWDRYKIVVLQQPHGQKWLNLILTLKKKGIKVLYEIDDYLRGVEKTPGHAGASQFSRKKIKHYETCMRACTGVICSTDYLAQRYRFINKRTWVCRNSIEIKRYQDLDLPARDTVNIGWAGGVGHDEPFKQWLPAIDSAMNDHEHARFVSIGQPYGTLIGDQKRAISLPQVPIENFPAALTNFDIALAPAGKSSFFKGKSDLRWLETGALGIPLIADPSVYGQILDGHSGYHASSSDQVLHFLNHLIEEPIVRRRIGANAREVIKRERSIEVGREQWERVFVETVS